MKQIILIILLLSGLFILYSCTPIYDDYECTYEYPVNIKNLKDTIKTTDTLWVENDFSPRFCLKEGVFENGVAEECPTFYKLINDTLIWYSALIIGYDRVDEQVLGLKRYWIDIRERDGRYKSRYGIVFPESGTYALYASFSYLRNWKDRYIILSTYFDAPDNNNYLLPEKLQKKYSDMSNYYFISVVE